MQSLGIDRDGTATARFEHPEVRGARVSAPVERPIIFGGPMVRAILEGRKTQTRRIARLTCAGHVKEPCGHRRWHPDDPDAWRACPYGVPGDRLWVRETWGYRGGLWSSLQPHQHEYVIHYQADDARITYTRPFDVKSEDRAGLPRQVCKCKPKGPGRDEFDVRTDHAEELERYWQSWRSSIHMPRWASRLTLAVTDVRVQRLQEIDRDDVAAEMGWLPCDRGRSCSCAPDMLRRVWDRLNGKRAPWASNPWVWAVAFEIAP